MNTDKHRFATGVYLGSSVAKKLLTFKDSDSMKIAIIGQQDSSSDMTFAAQKLVSTEILLRR
jgi:hypothetical protein